MESNSKCGFSNSLTLGCTFQYPILSHSVAGGWLAPFELKERWKDPYGSPDFVWYSQREIHRSDAVKNTVNHQESSNIVFESKPPCEYIDDI